MALGQGMSLGTFLPACSCLPGWFVLVAHLPMRVCGHQAAGPAGTSVSLGYRGAGPAGTSVEVHGSARA